MPNYLRLNEKVYKSLIARCEFCTANSDPEFAEFLHSIETDLYRTYASFDLFNKGSKMYDSLKNILSAFALLRPDLGYVQGMSFLAATFLLNLQGKEYEAFVVFTNFMMSEEVIYSFYSFEMTQVHSLFDVFMQLIEIKLPYLYNVFESQGLANSENCGVFLFEWIIVCYSNIFDLELASKLWDNLLFCGTPGMEEDYQLDQGTGGISPRELYMVKLGLGICKIVE